MPQIVSILCPVDFSEFSVTAYQYARSLAWHYKAKLFLQHVLYPLYSSFAAYGSSTDAYEQICCQMRTDLEQKLHHFAQRYARTEIQPECIVQDGLVTDMILSLANEKAVDLIVMGTHGLRGIDRLMLGSASEKVLRRSKCPVLAVRRPAHHVSGSAADPEPVHLKKLLLCTDFSDHAHHASRYALSLAKEYRAELTLLHVLEEFPKSADLQSATEKADRQLEECIEPGRCAGCVVKTMVRVGKPYQQIIQLALEMHTDLVVMGVRGRGALDTALFGSTIYRVIQLGSCPVLAVHV
jgi:nucleotide-binding universal stress UspA family protein